MGLFNRKSMSERQADAMRMAEDVSRGKGAFGKMAQTFMGKEFTEALQGATASMRQVELAGQLRAAGVPTQSATVVSIQDTGQTINDDPNVVLTLDIGGHQVSMATLVSQLEIPRTGDSVLVVREPQSGALLYAGLAPQ